MSCYEAREGGRIAKRFQHHHAQVQMFNGLPSAELLNATHEFPCAYVFKAIGSTEDHFVARVIAAVRSELDESEEPSFSTRQTPGGRHVCVTIEPEMQSADHVISVYARLQQVEGLVMLV